LWCPLTQDALVAQYGYLDLYTAVGGHYPGDLWANSLYRNEGHKNHWLGIDLGEGAIGAWLRLRADDHLGVVEIGSGPGFGSTNDLRAEIGLGARTRIDSLEIRWPDGAIERHTDLDQFHRFAENMIRIAMINITLAIRVKLQLNRF